MSLILSIFTTFNLDSTTRNVWKMKTTWGPETGPLYVCLRHGCDLPPSESGSKTGVPWVMEGITNDSRDDDNRRVMKRWPVSLSVFFYKSMSTQGGTSVTILNYSTKYETSREVSFVEQRESRKWKLRDVSFGHRRDEESTVCFPLLFRSDTTLWVQSI